MRFINGKSSCIWCGNPGSFNASLFLHNNILRCDCGTYINGYDDEICLKNWENKKVIVPFSVILPPGEIINSTYKKYKGIPISGEFQLQLPNNEDTKSIISYFSFFKKTENYYYPIIFDIMFLPHLIKYTVSLTHIIEEIDAICFFFIQHHGPEIEQPMKIYDNNLPIKTSVPAVNSHDDLYLNWQETWNRRMMPPIIKKGLDKLLF
jgi:hypothetical protein